MTAEHTEAEKGALNPHRDSNESKSKPMEKILRKP